MPVAISCIILHQAPKRACKQREQLQALLDSVYTGFVSSVAEARGKTEEQVSFQRSCHILSVTSQRGALLLSAGFVSLVAEGTHEAYGQVFLSMASKSVTSMHRGSI